MRRGGAEGDGMIGQRFIIEDISEQLNSIPLYQVNIHDIRTFMPVFAASPFFAEEAPSAMLSGQGVFVPAKGICNPIDSAAAGTEKEGFLCVLGFAGKSLSLIAVGKSDGSRAPQGMLCAAACVFVERGHIRSVRAQRDDKNGCYIFRARTDIGMIAFAAPYVMEYAGQTTEQKQLSEKLATLAGRGTFSR